MRKQFNSLRSFIVRNKHAFKKFGAIAWVAGCAMLAACTHKDTNSPQVAKTLVTVVNKELKYKNTFEVKFANSTLDTIAVGDIGCAVLTYRNSYALSEVRDTLVIDGNKYDDEIIASSKAIDSSKRIIPVTVELVDRGTYSVISKQ